MNLPTACAHARTVDFQRLAARQQPAEDGEDFADARRGFIGSIPDAAIARADGAPVWNLAAYGFLAQERAPDTVHPALWRQARLNHLHGLFQVTARIFQVRGLDIANITFIETEHGVVAFDALTCRQTAAAALALYRRHRGERPLLAVIYSHSHVDHFGGVAGLPLPARRDRAADEPRPEGRRDRRAPAAAPGALGPLARGRISNAASSAGWPR